MTPRVLLGVTVVASACVAPEPALPSARGAEAPNGAPAPSSNATRPPEPGDLEWQPAVSSPQPSAAEGLARELGALCPRSDAALERVAARLADRLLAGRPAPDPAELTLELRAAGSPYVWPRSWSYAGGRIDPPDALARAKRWLDELAPVGRRTCGASVVKGPKSDAVTLVLADALADLDRVPSGARVGQWLDVRARALVTVHDAKLVVLGPRGAPRTLSTSLDQDILRGRFAPSDAGSWLVQLVAETDTGPRPVAEAIVHVGVRPPPAYQAVPAPGEGAAASAGSEEAALERMINAARKSERLGELRRDERLDAAARAQAEAMRDARLLGHDVGAGNVGERLSAQGLAPRAFGENVARAASAERCHRAIWASPSHRGNLLEPRYDSMGVGAARGPDGLWVAEVFADLR